MRPVNENDAINLIFGGGLEVEEELSDIEDEIEELDATQRKEKSERPSTYVRVMEGTCTGNYFGTRQIMTFLCRYDQRSG